MRRLIKLKNFRNIGFKSDETFLLLNNSVDENLLGCCLYLIGPNNSGKTNILEGLELFSAKNKQIPIDDRPDFVYDEENIETKLELICEDEDMRFVVSLSLEGQEKYQVIQTKEFENRYYGPYFSKIQHLKESLKLICDGLKKTFLATNVQKYDEAAKAIDFIKTAPVNLSSAIEAEKEIDKCFTRICSLLVLDINSVSTQASFLSPLNDKDAIELLNSVKNPEYKKYEKEDFPKILFKELFNLDLLPKVVPYVERPLTEAHLVSPYNEWESSPLLSSLFSKLGITKEAIDLKYKKYNKNKNHAEFEELNERYEEEMAKISLEFNEIYSMGESKYKFGLVFDKQDISFSMRLGKSPITLSKQSNGFKWFFNFFFNFMFKNTLKPGDILIMDEPCLYLHVHGIEEIRERFRKFAEQNKITILISTHSPFFVSPDHFNDVRVVNRESDKETTIYNNFEDANACNKNDTLAPIVEAFTTYSSVVVNPENKKILVEGITDYNYLTAFKIFLKQENIVFIPFNGVGKKKKDMVITCNGLERPAKSGTILVDADNNGKEFVGIAEKKGFIVKDLSSFDDKWIDIESLFTEEEIEMYHLMDKKNGLGSEVSSNFKKQLMNGNAQISERTKSNFAKLFRLLIENK